MNYQSSKIANRNININIFKNSFYKNDSPLSKVIDNQSKKSISSILKNKKNKPSNINNLSIYNESPPYKHLNIYNISSKKNNKYSFYKKANHEPISSKQNTFIFQKKQFFERYNLENESNIINNTNKSFLAIENNLIKEINKIKHRIRQKHKNKLKGRNSCSNFTYIDSKDIKKKYGHTTLYPKFSIDKPIKKYKSFDFTESSLINLRNRIKNEIKDKIQTLTITQKTSNRTESFDSEDNSSKISKNARYMSFSPNSNFIFVFDLLLIISNLYSFIFIPLSIAKNENIFETSSNFEEIIKYLNDFIYILDFLISLFKGYFNYEMEIIRENKKIIINYLKHDFLNDLIEGIPIYVLIRLFNDNKKYIHSYIFDYKMFLIKLLLFIKSFKIFKILGTKKNKALEDFYIYLSVFYYLEKTVVIIICFIIFLLFIHLFIC